MTDAKESNFTNEDDVSYANESYDEDYVDDSQDDDASLDEDLSFEEEDYSEIAATSQEEEGDDKNENMVNLEVSRGGSTSYNIRVVKQDNLSNSPSSRRTKRRSSSGSSSTPSNTSKNSTPLVILLIIAALAIIGFVSSSWSSSSLSSSESTINDNAGAVGTNDITEGKKVTLDKTMEEKVIAEEDTFTDTVPEEVVEEKEEEISEDMITRESVVQAVLIDHIKLEKMLNIQPGILHVVDENGWNILHEAVRGRNLESVTTILNFAEIVMGEEISSYINARTEDEKGGNALYFAQVLKLDDIVLFLESKGGVAVGMDVIETEVKSSGSSENTETVENDSSIQEEGGGGKKTYTYRDAALASHQDSKMLSKILTAHPELLDHKDDSGWSILHEASRGGNAESVAFILDMRNDVEFINMKNKAGGNALQLAQVSGNQKTIDLLVSKGAVEFRPQDEASGIYTEPTKNTSNNGKRSKEDAGEVKVQYTQADAVNAAKLDNVLLQEILNQNPGFVKLKDKNGWTILHEATRIGNTESVKVILEYADNDDINVRTIANVTALDLAIVTRKQELIDMLTSKGSVESLLKDQDETFKTLNETRKEVAKVGEAKVQYTQADAVISAREDHVLLKKILNQNPGFVKLKDKNGWTILHEATRTGNTESVKVILEYADNDDINFRTSSTNTTALDLARDARKQEIIDMLASKGGVESLPENQDEVIETLNETRKDAKVQYTQADAVIAAREDHVLLKEVLNQNPGFVKLKDNNGWMILHEASRAGNIEAVKLILDYMDDEDDINVRTSSGKSPLWYAKKSGREDIVKVLESRGGIDLSPTARIAEL